MTARPEDAERAARLARALVENVGKVLQGKR
jgi:hypothetical protein